MSIPMDTTGSNGIKVELSYPPVDDTNFHLKFSVPLLTMGNQVKATGSFPETLILTGNASRVSGTVYCEMRNIVGDNPSFADRIAVSTSAFGVTMRTPTWRLIGSGSRGSLTPFEVTIPISGRLEIPLEYRIPDVISALEYELFVRAEVAGGYSERTGRGQAL